MKKGEMLSTMLVLAVNSHFGQYDKGGQPYILHPLKVMHYLDSDDEELNCMAVGHDLIEDCKAVTYELLRSMSFTERVVLGIRALTRLPGQTDDEYEAQVLLNPDAIKVKLCDLRHNSDIRRLKGVLEKDIKRMIRYNHFYLKLKDARPQYKGI